MPSGKDWNTISFDTDIQVEAEYSLTGSTPTLTCNLEQMTDPQGSFQILKLHVFMIP